MGPFPHDASKAVIAEANPAGTDGFDVVEFPPPDPDALRRLFAKMGYTHVADHERKRVELWQQGDISCVLNAEPGSFATRFAEAHGPCAPAHAVANGATRCEGDDRTMEVPAIKGIGGSLIYFVDTYYEKNPCNDEFDWIATAHPEGVGFF